MLTREITYETFDGETITDTFYFNLSRTELIELEVEYEDGLEAAMRRIVAANDRKTLIAEFQRIILLSYGEKSEDGKRFMKSDDIREQFRFTAAYDTLFMELATDENAAADFIRGVIPREVAEEIDVEESTRSRTPEMPPPPAPPSV